MKRLFTIACAIITLHGMESDHYLSRRATKEDLGALLHLIETQAKHDANKIVILPKKFRLPTLQKAIEEGHIFVTENSAGKIIGFKKLFLISQDKEADILEHEIRCKGPGILQTDAGFIDENGTTSYVEESPTEEFAPDSIPHIYIYNGGDFTSPEYRGRKINKYLTDKALSLIKDDVKKTLSCDPLALIAMFYGLTRANAGEEPESFDRTPSIAKSFMTFVHSLQEEIDSSQPKPTTLEHYRYRAFMPTFDENAQEIKPLPDTESLPGYGCILSCLLKNEKAST